jgi:hypothetical protein
MEAKYRCRVADMMSHPYIYLGGWVLIVLFNTVISPYFPQWMGYNNEHIPRPLDLYLTYDITQVHSTFSQLGEKGRMVYALFERWIDIPYMILYSLVYMTTLYKLTGRRPLYRWMLFPPVLIGFFDLMENAGILSMLGQYPVIVESKVQFTSLMTSLKWLFAGFTFLLVLYILYLRIINKNKQ